MEKKAKSLLIIEKLKTEYPNASTVLEYGSIFELVLAVLLSAQSTDIQVNKVTKKLFRKYKTPDDFAAVDLEELEEMIKEVGLYRNKARNIKKLSIMLVENFDRQVPEDFNSLMCLPGIGRKSANVILAVGFNKPGLGVDTHVHRVANRIGLVKEERPEKTEIRLKSLLPEEIWGVAHHVLIYHGRSVCKARKPECDKCIIEDLCKKIIL